MSIWELNFSVLVVHMLVGGALMKILFPNVFTEIALLMPSGFCGGHGYASTIGTALNNSLGREDGVVLGQTFATVGPVSWFVCRNCLY